MPAQPSGRSCLIKKREVVTKMQGVPQVRGVRGRGSEARGSTSTSARAAHGFPSRCTPAFLQPVRVQADGRPAEPAPDVRVPYPDPLGPDVAQRSERFGH